MECCQKKKRKTCGLGLGARWWAEVEKAVRKVFLEAGKCIGKTINTTATCPDLKGKNYV